MMTSDMPPPARRAVAIAEKHMTALLDVMENLEDPWDRALATGWLLNELVVVNEELRSLRNETVQALNDAGHSYREMSERLGLSTGRIQQMRNNDPGPRRRGKIEIAVETTLAGLSASAPPQKILGSTIPVILSFRHGSRLTAQRVAELTGLPVGVVRGPWKQAVAEFLEEKNLV